MSLYSWHAQTFLLPAGFTQFERTYKARGLGLGIGFG